MTKLEGRVAIVTGAAYGERAALGAEYAKALAEAGAAVVCADLNDCSDLVADIKDAGGKALATMTDVRDEAQIRDMVEVTKEEFGRIDILVNNAAIGSNIPPVPVTEMTVETWDELMAVNLRGPFLCVKAVTPIMQKQNYGKIINIGSTTMMSGLTNRLHYTTAKGGILAMTRSLATELGPDGIRVNNVAYGLVTSRLNEEELNTTERGQKMLEARALRQHVRAEDLTGTLIYLASSDSDHMTGQTLVVDGGGILY